jgi:hypothetical protein
MRGVGDAQMARKDNASIDGGTLEPPAVANQQATSRLHARESAVGCTPNNVSRIDQRDSPRNVQQDVPRDAARKIPSIIPRNASVPGTCPAAKRRNVASRCLLRPQPLCRCMAM